MTDLDARSEDVTYTNSVGGTVRIRRTGEITAVWVAQQLVWLIQRNHAAGDWTLHDERRHQLAARFPTKAEADAALTRDLHGTEDPDATETGRVAVVWGCTTHGTPRGAACGYCADQGALFSRAQR